jgi:hypothetical protein
MHLKKDRKSRPRIPSVGISNVLSTMWKNVRKAIFPIKTSVSKIPKDFLYSWVIPFILIIWLLSIFNLFNSSFSFRMPISDPVSIRNVNFFFILINFRVTYVELLMLIVKISVIEDPIRFPSILFPRLPLHGPYLYIYCW